MAASVRAKDMNSWKVEILHSRKIADSRLSIDTDLSHQYRRPRRFPIDRHRPNRHHHVVERIETSLAGDGKRRVGAVLPLDRLAAGAYALKVTATSPSASAATSIGFRIR